MANIARLQIAWGADSGFPRDRVMIDPVFQNTGGVFTDEDWDGICEDCAVAIAAWSANQTGAREVTVKAYDVEGTPPVFPMGSHTVQPGVYPVSAAPREIALCLSFYAGQNVPRKRGRLYVPFFVAAGGGELQVRPTAGEQAKIGALAAIFANLGGIDVDWSVYSKVDGTARAVSNWWVDNEWDIIRSRGLRGDQRIAGAVNE